MKAVSREHAATSIPVDASQSGYCELNAALANHCESIKGVTGSIVETVERQVMGLDAIGSVKVCRKIIRSRPVFAKLDVSELLFSSIKQKGCSAFHSRREWIPFSVVSNGLTSFPEDASMPYSGFEPELTRFQAECHNHHTVWGGIRIIQFN
ncbi:hypothetical protein TNCV_2004021 [Trichonephila clavipes]|nr:hypothetical protein TNCV_2004021 [Trichonephila clavipes]